MNRLPPSLAVLLAVFAGGIVLADDPLPETRLAQRGKLLLSEDLARAPANIETKAPLTQMKSGWKMWSGQWEFAGGAMKGIQQESEKRGAVAACVFPFNSAIIQFEMRLDDCRQVRFRVQDSTPEHICSVIITKEGFTAQKDDHDHGGPDQAVPFGKAAFPIKPDEWKTVLVEITGEQMAVTMGGQKISGAHPLIDSPKAFFDFVVSGGFASFRNLRVWEALPNTDLKTDRSAPSGAK